MMSQPKGKQKRSGFTVRWKRSRLPPLTDTELLLCSEDLFGSDQESLSGAHPPRLSEKEWPETKRAVQNSIDPPTPKEAWDKTLIIARDIEARKGVCDELKTEVSLVPPDEKNAGESIANKSGSPDTTTSHQLPQWVGQEYIEAYCMGCLTRGYMEEHCADCYELSHYDEDGNTIESIRSDCVPERSVMTFTQMAATSPSNNADDEQRNWVFSKEGTKTSILSQALSPPKPMPS